MSTLRLLVAIGSVFLGSATAAAEEVHCKDTESISQCADRVVFTPVSELRAKQGTDEAKDTEKKAVEEKAKADVKTGNKEAAKNDQAGTATGGAKARSTITDMIPWLNMLGLLSDSDASDGTIAADLNFLLSPKKNDPTDRNSQLRWVVDVSPEPFEPLIEAIPEGVRDEREKALQDKIEETGDSELQFTYSLVNNALGRDFGRNEARVSSLIATRIFAATSAKQAELDAVAAEVKEDSELTLATFIRSLPKPADSPTTPSEPARPRLQMPIVELKLTGDQRKELDELITKMRDQIAPAISARLNAVQKVITAPEIKTLAALVRHQPQLLFSANKKYRDELVGPESWGAKITYERSFVSLSNFFAKNRTACSTFETMKEVTVVSLDVAKPCLTALTDYVGHHQEDLENNSRWLVSLEYKQVDDWQYALPDDGVALDRPGHDRIVASAGFGRAVRRTTDVKDRIDFEAAYDSNLDDDDNYKSRFVVTLTYTRRFNDMDIPFSIVYANKSEFLEGTDKQIGLHVGLKYRALD